jgi:hypothetical protein
MKNQNLNNFLALTRRAAATAIALNHKGHKARTPKQLFFPCARVVKKLASCNVKNLMLAFCQKFN